MNRSARCVFRHATLGLGLFALIGCLLSGGCWSRSVSEVVVYSEVDPGLANPIFSQFWQETEITVQPEFDVGPAKSGGLAEAILAEQQRPCCDVFWNHEILNTLRLEKQGLLEAYHTAVADKYPAAYRSPAGLWYGFAARARVLIVNTSRIGAERRPRSILDLARPTWRGCCGMADPRFGAAATHAACLFAAWGPTVPRSSSGTSARTR